MKILLSGKGKSGEAYLELARKRFMAFVVILPSGCWQWVGSFAGSYGTFYLRPRKIGAHVASFVLFKCEETPDQVCHTCDHTWCVNPAHLFAGNYDLNMLDRQQKGRTARGFALPHTKLTPEQVEFAKTAKLGVVATAKLLGVSHARISKLRSAA